MHNCEEVDFVNTLRAYGTQVESYGFDVKYRACGTQDVDKIHLP